MAVAGSGSRRWQVGRFGRRQVRRVVREVRAAQVHQRHDPVQAGGAEVAIGVLDDVELDLVGIGLGARDGEGGRGLPIVVLELEAGIYGPGRVLGRLRADRVERVDVLGLERIDVGAVAVRRLDDERRADLADLGDGRGGAQARIGPVTSAGVDIEQMVGGLIQLALGHEGVGAELPGLVDAVFKPGGGRKGRAAIELDQLARLAGVVDAARILGQQRVVDRVRAGGSLVAQLDRTQAVAPRIHRDRVAAELFVLPGDHAKDREVVGQVLVVAQRGQRAAEASQVIVLVGQLGEAAVLARQGGVDPQVDIARQAAGQVRRRRRLDHVDRGEDVRVERAQRR